jgi:hypothetical protein
MSESDCDLREHGVITLSSSLPLVVSLSTVKSQGGMHPSETLHRGQQTTSDVANVTPPASSAVVSAVTSPVRQSEAVELTPLELGMLYNESALYTDDDAGSS